jgi:signal transduction histidine kinase
VSVTTVAYRAAARHLPIGRSLAGNRAVLLGRVRSRASLGGMVKRVARLSWRRSWRWGLLLAAAVAAVAGWASAGAWFVVPAVIAAAAVALPDTRVAGVALGRSVAVAVAAVSLAVTAAYRGPLPPGNAETPWLLAETAALLVVTARTVRRAPRAVAAVGGVLGGLAVGALPLRATLWSVPRSSLLEDAVVSLMWTVGPAVTVAIGLYLRRFDTRGAEQVHQVRREQRLALARDLHDFVAHDIGGLVLDAQAAQLAEYGDPRQALAAFQRIETAGLKALATMDRSVRLLRDQLPAHAGAAVPGGTTPGVGDLREVVDRFAATVPADVCLQVEPGLERDLGEAVSATAYRVVAEALTNVRRHAHRPRRVTVALTHQNARTLHVSVTDDGAPASTHRHRPGGGFGLVGLAERVELLDGTLTTGPLPTGGWRVEVLLPT